MSERHGVIANMSQGRALTHGHVGTPSNDVGKEGQHEPLKQSHGHGGPQLGFQAQGKNMSFATGSVSPRKEPRGRKRRSKLSQILLGDGPHAASSSTIAGLGSPSLPPLSAHLHMQLRIKPEAVFLCPSSKVPRGGQVAPATSSAGPLLQESPLGLTLKKTPSLLDLISSTLGSRPYEGWRGHGDSPPDMLCVPGRPPRNMPTFTGLSSGPSMLAPGGSAAPADKLKASNFAALSAKIGTWERHSRYEGDLVAKCYFAKKKLVWEVLEQGLKSKVEVQWGDIKRIKAACSDTEPGVLEIDIAKAPMFFHEMSPQPRKHTIWSNAPDFTGGQATIARKHVLTFAPGVLEPHYKKLLLCDSRLRAIAAGLPEPVAMRPPPHHKLQVPRPVGSVPCMPTPRHFSGLPGVPSATRLSGPVPWLGLVDNMQRVLLQERPGSPSSVIGRGDRTFGEESGSSEDTGHLLPPPGMGFVDANFARGSEAEDQDEMMLDSPFAPAEGPFPPLDFARSPPAGLFSDMPYDLPNPELLVDAEMDAAGEALCGAQSEGVEQGREMEAADQLSSSQPQGFSVFSEGGRLRKYGFSSSVPSLGSEMSAFHVVRAGPKALRSGDVRLPPGPSPLHDLESQIGSREFLPGFGIPVNPASCGGAASASAWRSEQELSHH